MKIIHVLNIHFGFIFMGLWSHYLYLLTMSIASCNIVQIMLYLCCRSLVDLVGHVQDHMIIETSTETSFQG